MKRTMRLNSFERGPTYHKLLERYIDQVGRHDRACGPREIKEVSKDWTPRRFRAVGQVVARDGMYEIHLVKIDPDSPRHLVRSKLRSFPSRAIAEIVARYAAAAAGEEILPEQTKENLAQMCWN
jgi:hypothetical protein